MVIYKKYLEEKFQWSTLIQKEIIWYKWQEELKSFQFYKWIQIKKLLIHWTHNNTTIISKNNQPDKCPSCSRETNTLPHFYQCKIINTQKQWKKEINKLQCKLFIPSIWEVLKLGWIGCKHIYTMIFWWGFYLRYLLIVKINIYNTYNSLSKDEVIGKSIGSIPPPS